MKKKRYIKHDNDMLLFGFARNERKRQQEEKNTSHTYVYFYMCLYTSIRTSLFELLKSEQKKSSYKRNFSLHKIVFTMTSALMNGFYWQVYVAILERERVSGSEN